MRKSKERNRERKDEKSVLLLGKGENERKRYDGEKLSSYVRKFGRNQGSGCKIISF